MIVPRVMGHTLRLHPLLVIFGLLAGGEIYGFPGILVALPLLAALRAAWEFFSERIRFQKWTAGEPEPLTEVGVELDRRAHARAGDAAGARDLSRERRTIPA